MNKKITYYRLWDNDTQRYMSTGYNAMSKEALRAELLSYLSADPPEDEEDRVKQANAPIEHLCEWYNFTIEKSETPFPEQAD